MIFTVQGKSLSLAGLMNAKAKALLVVCHRVNLSKPVTLRATDSGVQNAWRSFETITRDGHHTCSNVFSESIKKDLMFYIIPVYGYNAPAKSGAGIGVLEKYKATHDAPSVFFCVLTFAHPFFQRCGYNPCRLQSYGELDGGGEIRAGYLVRRLRQPCSAHHQ